MKSKIYKIRIGGVPITEIVIFRDNGKTTRYNLTRKRLSKLKNHPEYHLWAQDDMGNVFCAYIIPDRFIKR